MRLVVLDRDGVINHESDAYIKSPDEWIPISGSLEAVARLNQDGFSVVVATNQAGVGRGFFDLAALAKIHAKMTVSLAKVGGHLDGIFFCPHRPEENCGCRKPGPGLLRQIAESFHVSLSGVPVIGDSLRDIEAAETVGARPILVRTGYGEETLRQMTDQSRAEVFANLSRVVDYLIKQGKHT